VDRRLLSAPAMSRSPTSSEPSRWRLRPSPWERPPSSWPRAARRPLAESPGSRPCLGAGAGGGDPRRLPRRGHRRPDRPRLLQQRPAGPAGLPRRRGETSARSTTWASPAAGPDARHDDLRRRVSSASRSCASGLIRTRGDLGPVVAAARWSRPSRPFARHEERLRALSLRPAEYVRRQCASRPTRPRTWAGSWRRPAPKWPCFSSDYPHVEGGRRPLERFEASLGDASEEVRRRFYAEKLLGSHGTAASVVAA